MSEVGAILGEMGDAVRRQFEHADASHLVDRRGWTDQQWIDDARKLFDDSEGSVLDLRNGHIDRMLRRLRLLEGGTVIWWCVNHKISGDDEVGCDMPWAQGPCAMVRRLLVEVPE